MAHKTHNITDVHRGQHVEQPFEIVDEDGDPKNLTGATVSFYVLERSGDNVHQGDAEAALVKDTDANGGVEITNASEGAFEVTIGPDDYDAMPRRTHTYEVWIVDDDGNESPPVGGELRMDKSA